MLDQLDPTTVLTKFNKIAAAGKEVVATNVPTSQINTMMELALKAKKLPTSSLAVVPPLIEPGAPKFSVIRSAVTAKIAASEAKDDPSAAATPTTSSPPKKKKKSTSTDSKADTDDLTAVCSA
jgi:hypothetical protein